MNNTEFFDILSSNYDLMINFENSLTNKMENLKKFIESNYKTGLDLGCGTGVDSIALSQLGLKVTAVDHSKEMLKIAKGNSEKFGCKIDLIKSDLKKINFDKKFDLIISLGNTLVNLQMSDLKILFSKLKYRLSENGRILIQIVNYTSLPKTDEYILNTFEDERIKIVRKYLFHKAYIDFIIDITEKMKNKKKQLVTKIYPHSLNDFKYLSLTNNLDLEVFGSINMNKYIENKSANMVHLLS